jgi:integrase
MLDKIVDAGAPTTANDILSLSKQLFNHAIKRHIIKYNPASAFNIRDAGGTEDPRIRYLSHAELTLFFKAMRECCKFNRQHYLCTKFLLLVGCRKGELYKAKRSDFDLVEGVWNMSEDNKTNSKVVVPLSKSAMEIVKELMQIQIDDCEYLIPSMSVRTGKRGHIEESYLNKPIKNWVYPLMGERIENFTLHDFRATMKTHMCSKALGVSRFVSERCLNHKIPDMDGVYDRGDYFEERRHALELWSAFLETCEIGKAWNVTPIRKAI